MCNLVTEDYILKRWVFCISVCYAAFHGALGYYPSWWRPPASISPSERQQVNAVLIPRRVAGQDGESRHQELVLGAEATAPLMAWV